VLTEGPVAVTEGLASLAGAPAPSGGRLELASVPVTTRLRRGGAGVTGGGWLWRAVAGTTMGGGWVQSVEAHTMMGALTGPAGG
jgi:hypothetical protein